MMAPHNRIQIASEALKHIAEGVNDARAVAVDALKRMSEA
jgi:hypothetical protein